MPTYFDKNNNTTNILRTEQQLYQHTLIKTTTTLPNTSNRTTTLPTYFEQNNNSTNIL